MCPSSAIVLSLEALLNKQVVICWIYLQVGLTVIGLLDKLLSSKGGYHRFHCVRVCGKIFFSMGDLVKCFREVQKESINVGSSVKTKMEM